MPNLSAFLFTDSPQAVRWTVRFARGGLNRPADMMPRAERTAHPRFARL